MIQTLTHAHPMKKNHVIKINILNIRYFMKLLLNNKYGPFIYCAVIKRLNAMICFIYKGTLFNSFKYLHWNDEKINRYFLLRQNLNYRHRLMVYCNVFIQVIVNILKRWLLFKEHFIFTLQRICQPTTFFLFLKNSSN